MTEKVIIYIKNGNVEWIEGTENVEIKIVDYDNDPDDKPENYEWTMVDKIIKNS